MERRLEGFDMSRGNEDDDECFHAMMRISLMTAQFDKRHVRVEQCLKGKVRSVEDEVWMDSRVVGRIQRPV